ncbi:MAG: tetratricopeptide repeat protein [candidate division Zixibacteria bacterium]|nr:tetratricopeptide repeat protein [candidate division Zixibacteria bacterium]
MTTRPTKIMQRATDKSTCASWGTNAPVRLFLASPSGITLSLTHLIPAAIIIALLAVAGTPARADEFARRNNQGNTLLKKGELDQALQRYNEAKVERPDRPEVEYNIGNVYHLQGKLDSAAMEYQNALSTLKGPVAPNASYNLGNTFFRQQKYGPALEAYKEALIENPADRDAKHNLELTLRRMQADSTKQQQQQQDKDQQNKSDSTQQNQDQKQDQQKDQQKKDSTQQNQQSQQDKKSDSAQNQPPPNSQNDPQQGDQKKQQQQSQPVGMTKEDAKRLLDALKNDELKVQRLRAQHPMQEGTVTKDW